MNNQDFQNICTTLHLKYDEGRLTDADVDAFADVVTNVLGRDDLRADGTEYERLAGRINHDYENDIAMNPLLARVYELCRMYAMYRPRPLTEMERKEEQMEIGRAQTKKYPVCISIVDGRKTIASCWWEDLGGVDEIMEKVSVLAPLLPGLQDGESDIRPLLLNAFQQAGGALDALDVNTVNAMREALGEKRVKVSDGNDCGIIALDAEGVERNRVRKGANVKLSLEDRTVSMDAYIVYGTKFYKSLTRMDEDADIERVGEVTDDMKSFSFNDAHKMKEKWAALGDVFSIPGSDNTIGTKKPLAIR